MALGVLLVLAGCGQKTHEAAFQVRRPTAIPLKGIRRLGVVGYIQAPQGRRYETTGKIAQDLGELIMSELNELRGLTLIGPAEINWLLGAAEIDTTVLGDTEQVDSLIEGLELDGLLLAHISALRARPLAMRSRRTGTEDVPVGVTAPTAIRISARVQFSILDLHKRQVVWQRKYHESSTLPVYFSIVDLFSAESAQNRDLLQAIYPAVRDLQLRLIARRQWRQRTFIVRD